MKIAKTLNLLAILALVIGCSKGVKDGIGANEGDLVTIKGLAANVESGAMVIGDTYKTYYVEGVSLWAESVANTRVQVTGTLLVESIKDGELTEEQAAALGGMSEKRTILAPKWKQIGN